MANRNAHTTAQVNAVHIAVVDFFDTTYGRNESKLASWQNLCRDLRVEAGPSITQCKKNLKGTFVNIVDFVQAQNSSIAIQTYASAEELSNYMKRHGRIKFFPRSRAKQNPILRFILIHVR